MRTPKVAYKKMLPPSLYHAEPPVVKGKSGENSKNFVVGGS